MELIIIIIILGALALIGFIAFVIIRENKINEKIQQLVSNEIQVTPDEFFKLRNSKKNCIIEGVYIIYNETKNMYYIGQSTNLFKRVASHFYGRGNGDVYADYKYGDLFKITMIELLNSGFSSLNDLERKCIRKYNAYSKGYNKTRGNR
ncbi:GIY-YIG nuclease family protein [Malacoplasma muris]|uniref:GIY-YIG nuclease family protein n=1 Tax=Malacoplasma muris TaxID=2119 RepID=UPI00398F7DA4